MNAKYWVTNLLATTVGRPVMKSFAKTSVSDAATVYALAYVIDGEGKGYLLVNKTPKAVVVKISGTTSSYQASCVEAADGSLEPGFSPTVVKAVAKGGTLEMGGFGVCVVTSFMISL